MTKIYKITHNGAERFYTSITAALDDPESGLNISNPYFSLLVRTKGYPFEVSGCTVDQVFALSGSDVRERSEVENANVN